MLNFCEINIAHHIKQISANTNQDVSNVIKSIAEKYQDDSLQSWLSRILSINLEMRSVVNTTSLLDFFLNKDGQRDYLLYTKVKKEVRSRFIYMILDSMGTNVSSDSSLNTRIQEEIEDYKQLCEYNSDEDAIQHLFKIQNDIKNNTADTYDVADYLFINHFDILAKVWLSDIIEYNSDTHSYEFALKQEVRKDWNSEKEGEREPDSNSILKLILESTPLYRFTGSTPKRFDDSVILSQQHFFAALNYEINTMSSTDYENFIEDPYYIFKYLRKKYQNFNSHANFAQVLMHSFVVQWLQDGGVLYEKLKLDPEVLGVKPTDIIITAFQKYRENRYIEYDLTSGHSFFDLSLNENSKTYGKMSDRVTQFTDKFRNLFINNNGTYQLNLNATLAEKESAIKYFFGYSAYVHQGVQNNWDNALNVIVRYKNSKSKLTFAEWLDDSDQNRQYKSTLLAAISQANMYNPFIVSGTKKSKAGKQLPVMSVKSVGNSINECVAHNHIKQRRLESMYQNTDFITPKLAQSHSYIFSNSNIFLGTRYRASLSKTIKGETVTKESTSFSTPEAFQLAFIEDFVNNWAQKTGIIRIQAITPSDKVKIPLFEFDSVKLKQHYGETNEEIQHTVLAELHNIYAQQWLNTIIDFISIFDIKWTINDEEYNYQKYFQKYGVNASSYGFEDLKLLTNIVNKYIEKYTKDDIYEHVHKFNKQHGTQKNLAQLHDFVEVKTENGKIIQINPFHENVVKTFTEIDGNISNELTNIIHDYIKNVATLCPNININNNIIDVNAYLNADETINPEFFKSPLYTYFLLKNVLSENILINTVGTPIAHKGTGNWQEVASNTHITMVKRMVALTATMHSCTKNVLSGLPEDINTITIPNDEVEMFTYSGEATSGYGSTAMLETHDGAMYCPGFVSLLFKQSVSDVRTKGMDQKLILHAQDLEKSSSYLLKMANYVIDNAFLRTFGDPNMERLNSTKNPLRYIQLSLEETQLRNESFDQSGNLVDFNGKIFKDYGLYFKRNGIIYRVLGIKKDASGILKLNLNYDDNGKFVDTWIDVENNLWALWNAIGGQYTCDKYGNYNERSQEFIANLLNKIGKKRVKANTSVVSANDVDQYLKQSIIHYFPTASAVKSLKTPTVNWNEAINNYDKRFVVKMNIDNFGVQLDPDHDADDGEIREITQLISFLSERMATPELTRKVYDSLTSLIQILINKQSVDLETIEDPNEKEAAKRKAFEYFDQMMSRLFADPNMEVRGLANTYMRQIKKLHSSFKHAPFSDHQMLGKAHTSIGSMFRKYISRTWNGRADILVPSYNQCMIYEDLDGITYFHTDDVFKNGKKVNIKEHLHDLIFNEVGIKESFIQEHTVDKYNIKYGRNYYKITDTGYVIETIDSWAKLQQMFQNIENGVKYVPAIDLPRNLSDAQLSLDLTLDDNTHKNISVYFIPLFKEIIDIGIELSNTKDPIKTRELIELKRAKQQEWQLFLKAIYDKDVIIINKYLPENLKCISINTVVQHQENLTTNNYKTAFGGLDMNYSEVMQRKEEYFLDVLMDKFKFPAQFNNEDCICTLYTSSGTPTLILDHEPTNSNYKQIEPIVDEEGFVINEQGDILFKYLPGSKFYINTENGWNVLSIYIPENILVSNFGDFLNSGHFIFFRANKKLNEDLFQNLRKNRIFRLSNNDQENDQIFRRIAKKQYESWYRSNLSVMSRIPGQSQSFAAVSKTVGYLPYSNNIRMVPNSNVYIQGSDYDIDKVTAIMFAIDHNGIYKTNRVGVIKILNDTINVNDWTDTEVEIHSKILNLINESKYWTESQFVNNLQAFIKYLDEILMTDDIRISKKYLHENYFISNEKGLELYQINSAEVDKLIDRILQTVTFELIHKTGLEESEKHLGHSMQNTILESIIAIYDDPRTWFNQFKPTTMQPIHEAVSTTSSSKQLRNHWDPTTDVFVNQTTMVGKKDIGISAVAQKAFYALAYYYNDCQRKGKSILNISTWTLPKSWGNKTFVNLGFNGVKIDPISIKLLKQDLKDNWDYNGTLYFKQFESNTTCYIKEDADGFLYIGTNPDELERIEVNSIIGDFDLTSINSSIISSSTDNAKEMMMDLINATPEILPAYEFLLSLNIDLNTAVKILTDPIVSELIILSRGNLFENKIGGRTSSLFTNLNRKYIEPKIKDLKFDAKWKFLQRVFKGADELTTLGQVLGINGGFKVEIGEPLVWQLKSENHYFRATGKRLLLEKFIYSEDYAEEKIKEYEQYKSNINIYDVIYSVPHYREMFKVPILFKRKTQLISKDLDNMYTIGKSLSYTYRMDTDTLRMLLRAINDKKIVDFFFKYPVTFTPNIKCELIPNTTMVHETDNEQSLTTSDVDGLLSLKLFIETVIIPHIENKFNNNKFVENLTPRTMYSNLFGERITFYGSAIDLTDKQNVDLMEMIRFDFLKIQADNIYGKSIWEWMFIYDLLTHKHTISENSISMLLEDGVDINDPNNIATRWLNFINEYDNLLNVYSTNDTDWINIPGLKTLKKSNERDDIIEDDSKSEKLRRIPVFKYWPFFSNHGNFGTKILVDNDTLRLLFNNSNLIIKTC